MIKIPHNINLPIIHSHPLDTEVLIRPHGTKCQKFFKKSKKLSMKKLVEYAKNQSFVQLKTEIIKFLRENKDIILDTEGKELEDFIDYALVNKMGDLGIADRKLRPNWIFKALDIPENSPTSLFSKIVMVNDAKHMAVLSD